MRPAGRSLPTPGLSYALFKASSFLSVTNCTKPTSLTLMGSLLSVNQQLETRPSALTNGLQQDHPLNILYALTPAPSISLRIVKGSQILL